MSTAKKRSSVQPRFRSARHFAFLTLSYWTAPIAQLQPFKVGCLRQGFVTARPERLAPGDAEANSQGQEIGSGRCCRRIQRWRAQLPEQPQRFRRCACLPRHWILFRISLISSLQALSLPKDSETAISSKFLKILAVRRQCQPSHPVMPPLMQIGAEQNSPDAG